MGLLIGELLEKSVRDHADVTAVQWLQKREVLGETYEELWEHVTRIRRGLQQKKAAGKHIALIGSSSPQWIESYLAVITGGCVAVPLDAGLPSEDLIELLKRSDSEALFLSEKHKALIDEILCSCPKLKQIWMLQGQEEPKQDHAALLEKLMKAGQQEEILENSVDAQDIATIIYTSGTTGKSKGVMLTQENLAQNVLSVTIAIEPGTKVMSVLPIHHAFCLVMDWLKGFSLGATLCINDSYMHMVRNMGIYQPQMMLMVPMMLETLYKKLSMADASAPKQAVAQAVFGANLKTIFTGGAHLDPFYIEKFEEYGVQVLEGYGMSECSPVISTNSVENYKTGSIGRPLSNVEIAFEQGEILVRGSSVMKGYYKMPQETAEALRGGWLHTGDKGYIDEDGFLFINGRVKNLIILSNGENISPEEIENKLGLNPLVGEVIVTGKDQGLTANIYPKQAVVEASDMDDQSIQESLQSILDIYNQKQPTYRQITGLVVRKDPFVRNATGKIIREKVNEDEAAG